MKSYALIVNPVSGKGRGLGRAEDLRGFLLPTAASVEILPTTHRGAAIELAQECAGRFDRVIAVGGDGTLNEVVSGLMNVREVVPKMPEVGFLSAGTANAAAQAFRLPSDPKSLAAFLATAQARSIDVGVVRYDGGQRAFILWFGAGWDALVIHVLNADRSGEMGISGMLGHAPRLLRGIARYEQSLVSATVDGRPFGEHSTVVVANVPAVGFGGVVAESADPSDGRFDVVGVPLMTIPRFLRVGYRMMRSSLTRARGISHRSAVEIALTSKGEVPFHLDGEAVGYLPAQARLVKGALNVLAN